MRKMCLGLLAIACAGSSNFAAAQDIPPQASFMSLLRQGYEVRATSVVPLVEQRQFANTAASTHSNVLITMQKGQSVAVCTINWNSWSNMHKVTLEDSKVCDVR